MVIIQSGVSYERRTQVLSRAICLTRCKRFKGQTEVKTPGDARGRRIVRYPILAPVYGLLDQLCPDLSLQAAVTGTIAISPGDTLHLQAWYRDPPNLGAANFTNGIGPIVVFP